MSPEDKSAKTGPPKAGAADPSTVRPHTPRSSKKLVSPKTPAMASLGADLPLSGRANTPLADAQAALLAGDSGSVPPSAGVADLANVFAIALTSLRSPLEDVVARFDDIARSVPKGSLVHEGVSRARRSAFEAKRVLDSLHVLARPPREQATVGAAAVVTPVVRAVKEVFCTDTVDLMEILTPNLPDGLAEPLALRYALLNLAVAATRGCGGVGMARVIARAADEGGFLVEVDDEGPPLTPAEKDELFAPSSDERGRRSGLCLHLASRLAARAGCSISLLERTKGVALVLRVPPPRSG